jgi:hypothetical protein
MNGRVYDPLLGRFLSADPVVQSPDHTQSFNRYNYCVNNPLMFTDPSGYSHSTPIEYWEGLNQRLEDRMSGLEFGGFSGYGGGGGSYTSIIDYNIRWVEGYYTHLVAYDYFQTDGGGYVGTRYKPIRVYYNYMVSSPIYGYTPTPIGGYVSGNYGMRRPVIGGNVYLGNSDKESTENPSTTSGVSALALTLTVTAEASAASVLASSLIATLPLVVSGDTRQDREDYSYVVYSKFNPATKQIYIGRTAGAGTPEQVVKRRDY